MVENVGHRGKEGYITCCKLRLICYRNQSFHLPTSQWLSPSRNQISKELSKSVDFLHLGWWKWEKGGVASHNPHENFPPPRAAF
ncbi:uncharacterized protein Dsimw501_GD27582 [Drosophila simulans]|uniref:Uncharacterized protein n=1 Tax=Drosophila simulans TaxID=7240 RepID=A0A0J9RII4_DROSI|nr:uncharacterized protein Dsimw501_GD27582 [Drosophila simulans]